MASASRPEHRTPGPVEPATWPALPTLTDWQATLDAVHLWTQVVGKVRLALTPLVNHWWNVPLYVSTRGLTTSTIPLPGRGVELEFDFVDHVLALRTTEGDERTVALGPQSVATFHGSTLDGLRGLGVDVEIRARPTEMEYDVAFADDTAERPYDGAAVHAYWQALVQVERVLVIFRSRFLAKVSPVHFFWGAFDLAVTRFSGRPAPLHPGGAPNCPDWVMHEAYSHELSSAGFWPGGSEEGSFYAYAYPEPAGFADRAVPAPAAYDHALGEFVLPYAAVRAAADPDALALEFLQRTYEAAADLGGWDRPALEVPEPGHRGRGSPRRGVPPVP